MVKNIVSMVGGMRGVKYMSKVLTISEVRIGKSPDSTGRLQSNDGHYD